MQREDSLPPSQGEQKQGQQGQVSKHLGDHLANERTFLAWVRTGLSTITFGFVIAKFGLFLREMSAKQPGMLDRPGYFSAGVGILMTLLGAVAIVGALINFLHIRRTIDGAPFRPMIGLSLFLAAIAGCIGFTLAIYLFVTTYTF